MLQKKICVLGAFGVGKTSLVRRYVTSMFSDAYLTTVGVKIDKKVVDLGQVSMTMVLWDVAGEDDISSIRTSYLRGSAGYLLVADGTRPETLEVATSIQERVTREVGAMPFLVLLNKADIEDEWEFPAGALDSRSAAGWTLCRTSAKTGTGVEEAFRELAQRMAA